METFLVRIEFSSRIGKKRGRLNDLFLQPGDLTMIIPIHTSNFLYAVFVLQFCNYVPTHIQCEWEQN